MNSLTEVEAAIQKLSAIEVRQLAEWLQTYLNTEGNTEDEEEETQQKVTFVQNQQNAWDVLESIIGTVEAPPDWSINHDHYLYGTAKRYQFVIRNS
jgi:putative salt-induced outer membrane protein YdiY